MAAATVTRRVQRLLVAGVGFLLAWQLAAVVGAPRAVRVALGLHGFVFHVVFGKAYGLVPAYFDRPLAAPWAPAVQLPLSGLGAVGLAADAFGAPAVVGLAGAGLWLAGALVFVGALAWTVRDNPTGAETGTGEAKAHRRPTDRYANAFVPVVLAYLLAGSYDLLAVRLGAPAITAGGPAATHLLAAGAATLLVLAVGVRLLPRLLVASPPRWLVRVVLPAGALAPLLLALGFGRRGLFHAGAALEAVAVVGFAVIYTALFVRSDRRRAGSYALLLAVLAGTVGVLLGVDFAVRGPTAPLGALHARLNLLGFLGLAIIGVSYHVYPPNVGRLPGAGEGTAMVTVGFLAGGLAVEVVGTLLGVPLVAVVGRLGALVGAAGYAYLVAGVLLERGA